ncbi:MAG: hypothetical protein KJ042_02975 [Deltaproteobacteria bacterium]|nr:hypothetical protein [Deltaproteobacteria bacterium]
MRRAIVFLITVIFSALLCAGCAELIHVENAFTVAAESDRPNPWPMRVAIVRPQTLTANWRTDDITLNKRLTDAIVRGLATATRIVAREVAITDRADAAGYDAIVTVSNIRGEWDKGHVTFSMDVTLRRANDGKEWGLLVEGSGGAGVRPVETWERDGARIGLVGVVPDNPPFGRALHHAMFELCRDYAKKIDRRPPSAAEPAPGERESS